MKHSSKKAHKLCVNCRKTEKTVIEVAKMSKGKADVAELTFHKVIFIIKGSLRLYPRDKTYYPVASGKMLFLLAGSRCSYQAMEDTTVLLFRIQTSIQLCKNFSLEYLFLKINRNKMEEYKPQNGNFGELEMNTHIQQFVNTIANSLKEGFSCHYLLELKVDEFFLLLRLYYTKEEIYKFLYLILSSDITFSEQVGMHWNRFQTVGELAAFLNMTSKRFTARFTFVFGQTPYKWMLQGRARIIQVEITSTEKQFKQIAMENGFASESSFTRFCKKEFDKTPTQIRLTRLKKTEDM